MPRSLIQRRCGRRRSRSCILPVLAKKVRTDPDAAVTSQRPPLNSYVWSADILVHSNVIHFKGVANRRDAAVCKLLRTRMSALRANHTSTHERWPHTKAAYRRSR